MSSYEILSVAPDAGDDEIRSAYRKFAVRFHPDKNPDDPSAADRFRGIAAAYESIRNAENRSAYDISLKAYRGGTAASVADGNKQANSRFDLSDALRAFMSVMRSDTVLRESFEGKGVDPLCGSNVQITVALTLHDIALGIQKFVTIQHLKPCKNCNGSGASDSHPKLSPCRQCGGHGIVRIAGSGNTVKCPVCQGTAREVVNACAVCKGTGQAQGESTLSVKFPPGIGEGNVLTISGKGNAGFRSGAAGDLHIYVEEIPDSQYRRQGYDLETDATITLLTAVLGGRCMAVTLNGETVSLRIPEGTQPETLFSLKSYGMPVYKGTGCGNLLVRVHVKIPDKLSVQERMCYESLLQLATSGEHRESPPEENNSWLIRQSGDAWIVNGGTGNFDNTVFNKPEVIDLLEKSNIRIGIDLSYVNLVQSLTIGLWIKLWRKLQTNGSEFFIVNPDNDVMSVLVDMNMDSIFSIVNM